MRITLADGSNYTGATPLDIVKQLKSCDWTSYNNIEEYSKNMERRINIFFGEEISYSNYEEFLQELKRIGFIEKIELDK